MADFATFARHVASDVEQALIRTLPPVDHTPMRLHDAMRYASLNGGKRVRPMLVYAAGAVTNAAPERLQIVSAAIEMIHAYSLVHDDLPCMDDDVLRRGKPTCHVQFDEATALLAGDALQACAFELMASHTLADSPAQQLKMISQFALAGGSRGMAGGQAIDLDNVGKQISLPELEHMHILKTGALIRISVLLGAQCGEPLDTAAYNKLDHYAKCVGLAFQVVDDILDCEASTEVLGKTAGKDQDANKPTYVSLLGLVQAKTFAAELLADAQNSLSSFDSRASYLRELATFIVSRSN
jgi:farnesyl diphosphate synthase